MLANVAARLSRAVCCSYDMLAVAHTRTQIAHFIVNAPLRNETGVTLRHHDDRFRA
jgi:hypothetical protein